MLGKKRLVAVLAAVCFGVAPAAAQDYCASLRNQLARLPVQVGEEQYLQLLSRLNRERTDYNRLYSQARGLNCFALFQRFASPQCPSIRRTLSDLEASIANLEQATRSANPILVARGNILTLLQQSGCPVANTFRTLCVRPTDGYFYPLQYMATPENFALHELVCQAQCEGARLFVHRNPGEDVDDAVDLQGNRYTDLPNAFAYLETYDPRNACRPSQDLMPWLESQLATFAVDLPAVGATSPPQEDLGVPLPTPRPRRSEDPETIANRLGGFGFGEAFRFPQEAWAGLTNDNGVRLVGPAFYYAQ